MIGEYLMKKFKNRYEYFDFVEKITAQRMKERNADRLERSMGLCGEERREELQKAGYDPEEPFIRFFLKDGDIVSIDDIIYDNRGDGYLVIDIDYDYVVCKLRFWNHIRKKYTEDDIKKVYKFDVGQIKQMSKKCENW